MDLTLPFLSAVAAATIPPTSVQGVLGEPGTKGATAMRTLESARGAPVLQVGRIPGIVPGLSRSTSLHSASLDGYGLSRCLPAAAPWSW